MRYKTRPTLILLNPRIVWLGGKPSVEKFTKSKKGNSWEMMNLTFMIKESFTIQTNAAEGEWLVQMLLKLLFQILKPIIFKKSRVILKQILTILNYSGTQSLSIP
jgi:hypothetical protein